MIAFDAATNGTYAAGSQSLTHTCTGSNLILIASVIQEGAATEPITGVTYNGVALTQAVSIMQLNRWSELWYLINPSTGANTLTATSNQGAQGTGLSCASYTGVKQSGQPDATGTGFASPGTSVTATVTAVAANCWLVSGSMNDTGNTFGISGDLASIRATGGAFSSLADSNGVVATGARSATWTIASSNIACSAMSIIGTPTVSTGMLLMFR